MADNQALIGYRESVWRLLDGLEAVDVSPRGQIVARLLLDLPAEDEPLARARRAEADE